MTELHEQASRGYAKGAKTYAAGRPGYPAEVETWLREHLGVGPGRAVIDLGAGTGKFTALLAGLGASVVAVEPVAEMLEELRARLPGVEALSGTAQAIPAADGSAEAVTCAQAFHWFADAQALAEIRRVLKPGGALGLVWNVRDESVPWVAALTRIMAPYEGETPRFRQGKWRALFPAPGFGPLEESAFLHRHEGPPERVVLDRVLSVSFMAALDDAEKVRVAARLRALIAETPALAGRETVGFPYRTLAIVARKLG